MIPRKALLPVFFAASFGGLGPPAGAADWALARSPGFVVVAEDGESRAREIAQEFEQIRALFRQLFNARVDPGRPVVVLAVADERGMEALLGRRKGRPMPAGVFIEGAEKHLVALRGDAQAERSIIYHEFIHLLTGLNHRWVPVWLSEGLAEFYSTTTVDDDGIRLGRIASHHVHTVRERRVPLAELVAATRDSPLYNEFHRVGPFYANSAVLTHYLFFEPTRQGQLGSFLKLLAADVPEAEALGQAFGDLKKLDAELVAYSRRFAFQGMKIDARVNPATVAVSTLKPHEVDALRGDFMARAGRTRDARRTLEAVLAGGPPSAVAHEAMGILEADAGRVQEARRHFTEAARLSPRSNVAPYRLGLLALGGPEDRARREASLRTAIELNPMFPDAHAELARFLMEAGKASTEAVNLAARAAILDPGNVYYRVLQWQALERAGETEKAAKAEAALRRGASADAQTLSSIASHFEEVGRLMEAEDLIRGAQATNPVATDILQYFLGQHGRWAEAVVLARAAFAREPDSTSRQNSLAYALAESGRDLEEALKLVDRALKKDPRNASYLDTKGVVLFRMKRLGEAEAALREAAAESEVPIVLVHLADVLAARGRRAEAVEAYERALEMPDVGPRLEAEIRSRLDAVRASAGG